MASAILLSGPRMTVAQYARHREVSAEAVRKAIKTGRITVGADKSIDWASADAAWPLGPTAGHTVAEAQAEVEAEALTPRAVSQAKREATEAARAELKLQAERGELVAVKAVSSEWFAVCRQIRNALQILPSRVTSRVRAAPDDGAARRILEAEVRLILDTLAAEVAEADVHDV